MSFQNVKTVIAAGASFAALLTLPVSAAAQHALGPELVIENFVGRVTVTTAPGAPLIVTKTEKQGALLVRETAGSLTLDGGIKDPDDKGCKGYFMRWSVNERSGENGGYKNIEDYPKLEISGPDTLALTVKNAILFATLGDLGRADVDLTACGNIVMGDVAGQADLLLRGSGDIRAGNVGALNAALKGSGDIVVGDTGKAELELSGSGDITTANTLGGSAVLRGSGDIEMGDVRGPLRAELFGSGDISGREVDGPLIAELKGSGDIAFDAASLDVSLRAFGSGDIDIDGGEASVLSIKSTGSSSVRYNGSAKSATLFASGSTDIRVDRVTGAVDSEERGSGSVKIGTRG